MIPAWVKKILDQEDIRSLENIIKHGDNAEDRAWAMLAKANYLLSKPDLKVRMKALAYYCALLTENVPYELKLRAKFGKAEYLRNSGEFTNLMLARQLYSELLQEQIQNQILIDDLLPNIELGESECFQLQAKSHEDINAANQFYDELLQQSLVLSSTPSMWILLGKAECLRRGGLIQDFVGAKKLYSELLALPESVVEPFLRLRAKFGYAECLLGEEPLQNFIEAYKIYKLLLQEKKLPYEIKLGAKVGVAYCLQLSRGSNELSEARKIYNFVLQQFPRPFDLDLRATVGSIDCMRLEDESSQNKDFAYELYDGVWNAAKIFPDLKIRIMMGKVECLCCTDKKIRNLDLAYRIYDELLNEQKIPGSTLIAVKLSKAECIRFERDAAHLSSAIQIYTELLNEVHLSDHWRLKCKVGKAICLQLRGAGVHDFNEAIALYDELLVMQNMIPELELWLVYGKAECLRLRWNKGETLRYQDLSEAKNLYDRLLNSSLPMTANLRALITYTTAEVLKQDKTDLNKLAQAYRIYKSIPNISQALTEEINASLDECVQLIFLGVSSLQEDHANLSRKVMQLEDFIKVKEKEFNEKFNELERQQQNDKAKTEEVTRQLNELKEQLEITSHSTKTQTAPFFRHPS